MRQKEGEEGGGGKARWKGVPWDLDNTQAQIQLENEGLAFSLAGSDDGGLLLEDGNIIYLIFEYFSPQGHDGGWQNMGNNFLNYKNIQ